MIYDDYDMAKAARKKLSRLIGDRYPIAFENMDFTEPDDGGMWLKFDYIPADKIYNSLDRKCITLLALVQISIVFPPGGGVDDARALAKELVNFFEDGKILDVGFIFKGAESMTMQKSQRGWMLPVRYTLRYDEK